MDSKIQQAGEWIHRLFVGAMLSIIAFFLVNTYTRLATVELALTSVQIEMARLQVKLTQLNIPDDSHIREICVFEILKHQAGAK